MANGKKYIFAGILSIVPLYLTYIIANALFNIFSTPGLKIFKFFFTYDVKYLPEIISFLFTLLAIYIIGMLVSNIFGKKFQITDLIYKKA